MTRILLLGGTTEASHLAIALAERRADAVFSYAGRTASPAAQPLPTRIGGFGGIAGMLAYLQNGKFTHVVDATHPFAAQISANTAAACAQANLPLIGFERPAWHPGPGDIWQFVHDIDSAVAALPDARARVFLAIGKQNLAAFAVKAQHHYVLRLVDPPQGDVPLPDTTIILARGPFALADDIALLNQHRISHIVAKNAGGMGARAKLDAARMARIPVIMIDRPRPAHRVCYATVDHVLAALGYHDAPCATDLGV